MRLGLIENVGAYNCLLASVATVAKSNNRDFYMIASGDLTFRYEDVDCKRLGEQIDIVSKVDASYRAKIFHGFSWQFKDANQTVPHINENEYPLIVSVDQYDAKWSKYYQKYHFLHYLIACEYDDKMKVFRCIDPYYNYANYRISEEDFYNALVKCGQVVFTDLPIRKMDDYKQTVYEDFIGMNEENYGNIQKFAINIYEKMDIHLEFDEYANCLDAVPIMDKLRKIAMSRDAYAIMLESIFDNCGLEYLLQASDLMKQSVSLWKQVRAKLLKTYLTKSFDNQRRDLSLMLKQIANIERKMTDIVLFNYLEGN